MDMLILLSRYVLSGLTIAMFGIILLFFIPIDTVNENIVRIRLEILYHVQMLFFSIAMAILMFQDFTNIFVIVANWTITTAAVSMYHSIIRKNKMHNVFIGFYILSFLVLVSQIVLTRLNPLLATRQLGWVLISIVVAWVLFYISPYLVKKNVGNIYSLVIIGILALPFLFGSQINGALNWVNIGGISFQPSEMAKILYVIAIAEFLTLYYIRENSDKSIFKVLLLTAAVLLILIAQKDLGGAMLYAITFLVLMYTGTSNIIIPLVGVGVGAVGFGMLMLVFSHVQVRIQAWLNPWVDIVNTGYQMVQGLFAMGTWGVFGSGLTRGLPQKVPFVTTDFIFVAIVEELGVIIGMCVIFSYLLLAIWGIRISLKHRIMFVRYIIIGYTTFIVMQSFIILGGVMQILPLTGVTLPFVSYGGSSMFSSTCMIAIILRQEVRQVNFKWPSTFEQRTPKPLRRRFRTRSKYSKRL
ncbi:MAG: hypothetical protein ATN33_06100 [Epulopiscium sp. Nele67-Bin001]|nr:MAG: hypothetical protein BEN18_01300 [Epulopiscium sp. Nuni2H_MBin001]OON93103.1 MAG: hypothetical protein ATN33_06100 [Epulopiscium sp. Nele67-Bin001]